MRRVDDPKSDYASGLKALFALLDQQNSGNEIEKYEAMRLKLLTYFRFHHVLDPDAAADEAIDRVVEMLGRSHEIHSLPAYLFTVARHLVGELKRTQKYELEKLSELSRVESFISQSDYFSDHERQIMALKEARLECLEICLQKLAPGERELIRQYYASGDGFSKENLARKLGIEMNTLRIRAFRIRMKLLPCVRECGKRLLRRRSGTLSSLMEHQDVKR